MTQVRRRRREPAPEPLVVGWREWVALPDLGLHAVKAKVDTGAATSALHAVHLREFVRDGHPWLRFEVHPRTRTTAGTIVAEAPLVERDRSVRSSTGHHQQRPVIRTTLVLGGRAFVTELTLTDRRHMGFRLLLGRRALRGRALVDVRRSYVCGTPLEDP